MSELVLYTSPLSIWSGAAELAVHELGLGEKIKTKEIDLLNGENFDPAYVKINPSATIPSLVVDGKPYDSATGVIEYLIQYSGREVAGRTSITEEVHDGKVNPFFAVASARDDAELAAKAGGFPKTFHQSRHAGLKKFASTPDAASFKAFYEGKIASIQGLLDILNGEAPEDTKQAFFAESKSLWDSTRTLYVQIIPASISNGPFVAGEKPGEDDFHVGAFLAHLAAFFGAAKSEDGLAALEKGLGIASSPPKNVAYWNAWSERSSWKKIYGEHLR